MISDKQLEANRKNALKSTGPKTEAGKSISSKNALTHGLRAQQIVIEGESQEEFDDFRELLIDYLSPDGPLEMFLVDRIAAGSWRLRRTGHLEAQIFDEMRNSLAAARNQNSNDLFTVTLNDEGMDVPTRSQFASFQEAKSAWDATEDGVAFADGRLPDNQFAHDSFDKFLKDHRVPDTEMLESQPGDILGAISNIKTKYENRPDILRKLSELEDTFKSIAKHPKSVHIPSLRQYLQDLRELIHVSNSLTDKYAPVLDEAIRDISSIEVSIDRQMRPNLGQAISCDLKGPGILTKFIRYESQIQRGLFKAIHELNRLKANHQGRQTTAPIAIDVDVSG